MYNIYKSKSIKNGFSSIVDIVSSREKDFLES